MVALFTKQKKTLSVEDAEIINNINSVQAHLRALHHNYDYATDPMLIDSYIYEMSALYAKYDYYLKLCKEKGINIPSITLEVL